jgi:geranylgeranyl reductase family protein
VTTYDVAIIGAGPAGSTAAYRLAQQGARVALLDRAVFPRDKPCGGGLTLRGVHLLPVSVTPVVEHVVDTIELGLGHHRSRDIRFESPIAYMTQRRRLDAYLVERAVGAGAELHEGCRVRSVSLEGARPVVRVDGGSFTSECVLGADGANGVSARAMGLGASGMTAVALEGNVSYDVVRPDRFRGRVLLSMATVPGGYAWVFPKGDHVNVGVGGWLREGPRLREYLAELCRAHGIPYATVTDIRGHRLPMRRGWERLATERGLVMGDAAGLVDPLSGDGMFEAFLSAKLASEATGDVLAGRATSLAPYQRAVHRALALHAATAWAAKLAVEQAPRLAYKALGTSFGQRFLGSRIADPPRPGVPWRAMGASGLEGVARRLLGSPAA